MKRFMFLFVLGLLVSMPLFADTITIDFEDVSDFYVVIGDRTKDHIISQTTDTPLSSPGNNALNFTWFTDGAYNFQYAFAVIDLDKSYDFSDADISFWNKRINRSGRMGIGFFHTEPGQEPILLANPSWAVNTSWTQTNLDTSGVAGDLSSVNAIGFWHVNTVISSSGSGHTVYFDDFVATGVTPEPATMSLLLLSGIGLIVRRRN